MNWNFFTPPDKLSLRASDRFLDELVRTKGQDDNVLDRQVSRILRELRFRRAIEPWLVLGRTGMYLLKRPFAIAWRETYGRYRKPSAQVHVGAALQSGGFSGAVPGAGPIPAGQFTGYAGGFSVAGNTAPGPSQSFEDAGIRAGEVVAYRCWILRDGFLHSAYIGAFKWDPGVVAEGNPTEHGEGIHAFKNRLDACRYIGDWENDGFTVVSGTVELWGEVFEHSRGYRASRARIKSIDDSPHYDAAALRKQYQLNRKRKK